MLKITNIGHACFLFETQDYSFIIDPFRPNSVPGLNMPSIVVDKAFSSHNHYDHDGLDYVRYSGKEVKIDYQKILVPHDHHNGAHRGMNNMHVFNVGGYRIIHTGDLGCVPNDDALEQMKGTDILLAPINGHFTISSEELHRICVVIKPRLVIPMHYQIKEKGIGYPDPDEIGKFKKLFPDYKEVDTDTITVDESLFDKQALIFNKARGEIK